eukprot:7143571-Karenia_brevis.AAC.1
MSASGIQKAFEDFQERVQFIIDEVMKSAHERCKDLDQAEATMERMYKEERAQLEGAFKDCIATIEKGNDDMRDRLRRAKADLERGLDYGHTELTAMR